MPTLDHRDKTYQTADALRGRIRNRVYPVNTFLPSERKLAEELKVARTTLRSALDIIETEGYISRERGRGTMVRRNRIDALDGVIPLIIQQHQGGSRSPLTPEAMALIGSAMSACAGSDIRFLIEAMPEGGAKELVELVKRNDAPGLLFVECNNAAILDTIREASIPYAVINHEHDIPGPATRVDFWHIGRSAAEYLLELGHRRLGILSGPSEQHLYERMLAGFRGRAAEAEVYLSPHHIMEVPSNSEAARTVALQVLDDPERPTAIFCTRDIRAYGAYLAAREIGLSVPDDLSLMGYDDITWPGQGRDFLTTFPEPAQELSRRAIDILCSWIETGEEPEDILIRPELVVRKSTTRVPGQTQKEK